VSLVHMKSKQNGVTYVYESTGYWDKEKKQARNKRICIGKIDPKTGEFVPSKRMLAEGATIPTMPRQVRFSEQLGQGFGATRPPCRSNSASLTEQLGHP